MVFYLFLMLRVFERLFNMVQPKFIFTQYFNYFEVYIENLEKLSVEQIQEIELFVKKRNGIFDFNRYTFSIQKRLEFYQFLSLMEYKKFDVECRNKIIQQKPSSKIGFGQYKGMNFNDLTDSYMLWLKTNYRGYDREKVDEELRKRRLL